MSALIFFVFAGSCRMFWVPEYHLYRFYSVHCSLGKQYRKEVRATARSRDVYEQKQGFDGHLRQVACVPVNRTRDEVVGPHQH